MADSRPIFCVAEVQNLLAGLYASPVTVDRMERMAPWAVARVWLRGAAGVPGSVIVKRALGRLREGRTAGWRLRTELAALRFLSNDLGSRLVPRVLAADTAAGLLVLEDLAPRVSLDGLLRRDGAAEHGTRLAAFARARGALSAATAGRAASYYTRRVDLGSVDRAADQAGRHAPLREAGIEHASAIGVPLEGRAAYELASATDELTSPGPFLALSNQDAEANNILLHASGPPDARLIDFEFAGYTHALADAVCLYVPGPAWLTVGDPTTTGLADQYRHALALGIPEAEDDRRYGDGLAAACVSWTLIRLQRFPLLDTRPPGDHSRLQLISTLEAAAHTCEIHRSLPRLTDWIRSIAAVLRCRWPDVDKDLADPARFPPYTPRL
ncbi:phosphotransferase [Streptomyces sp. Tue6028]|uniref:phosphotransferase n=1 Tax=Streptomyces sp. Tue6028 TaxID=2036037 RepID=UPI003EBEDCC0